MSLLVKLLEAYVELNKLNAQPGDRCHMLAMSIQFLERKITAVIKQQLEADEWKP
jgi:hypothetical protein